MAYLMAVAMGMMNAAMAACHCAGRAGDSVAVRMAELVTSLMACDKFDAQLNGVRVEVGEEFVMTLAISLKGILGKFIQMIIDILLRSEGNQNTLQCGRTMLESVTYAMLKKALELILLAQHQTCKGGTDGASLSVTLHLANDFNSAISFLGIYFCPPTIEGVK
eukprot:4465587-Ditylum_brightwellii.AAC.1